MVKTNDVVCLKKDPAQRARVVCFVTIDGDGVSHAMLNEPLDGWRVYRVDAQKKIPSTRKLVPVRKNNGINIVDTTNLVFRFSLFLCLAVFGALLFFFGNEFFVRRDDFLFRNAHNGLGELLEFFKWGRFAHSFSSDLMMPSRFNISLFRNCSRLRCFSKIARMSLINRNGLSRYVFSGVA